MSVTIYYSKLNLSSHILDVYENPEELEKYLGLISKHLKQGMKYIESNDYIGTDGEIHNSQTVFTLDEFEYLGKKYNGAYFGRIFKEAPIFIKEKREDNTLVSKPVDNIESITFYFDLKNERVAFNTAYRFGYQEFNRAFEGIINNALRDKAVIFTLSLMKNKINLEDLTNELKKIGKISEIKVDIKAPNPDTLLLEKINQNAGKMLEGYKKANITSKSLLLRSNAPKGINVDSQVIKDELDEINNIHEDIDAEKAFQNGYVNVTAIGSRAVYNTKENHPMKNIIDDEQMIKTDFIETLYELMSLI
ncbi:hypothetical protein [Fusibacter ferrireducens]|uniref:Uncharacterized protein n=1 Tax=Fusibacter ferrireducens TaxID=2785058 RepID=A0ABR9ZT23_9FIRM|nr:hypothetical protein [Fusibacter ferrireducens]MBF4693622.1 hypothetical protein [Fusibacter ferrireducens]